MRRLAHTVHGTPRFKGMKFKILRKTTLEHINRLEGQIGRAYRRRGEAKNSKRFCNSENPKVLLYCADHDYALNWDWKRMDSTLAKQYGETRQSVNYIRRKLRQEGNIIPDSDYSELYG